MSDTLSLDTNPIRYADGVLTILDQTRLPAEEVWLELCDTADVVEAIVALRVRGAPLIGITGAYGVAAAARRGRDALESAAADISVARPTAVNLRWAVARVLARARAACDADLEAAAESEAAAIHDYEVQACLRMGSLGAVLIPESARVLTHCNTGSLATGGIGTALGVIRIAHERGGIAQVWVDETRPLLQGARLTAWELGRLGVPHAVVADAAAGSLFSRRLVDVVVVGADRIARNGDTANKVGTYTLAVLAQRHGVPFYVVAPASTIDATVESGASIPIEERHPDEVRRVLGTQVAPADAPAANPAFDVTPAELITAIVTDEAVERPPYRF